MASNDLTLKVIANLDNHLILDVLDHVEKAAIYSGDQVSKAKQGVLATTNLFDRIKACGGSVESGKEEGFKEALEGERKSCEALIAAVKSSESSSLQELAHSESSVSTKHAPLMFKYAQSLFSHGDYAAASPLMQHYARLCPERPDAPQAMWARLACSILLKDWTAALADSSQLKQHIDSPPSSLNVTPLLQLQSRNWLLHWNLFCAFRGSKQRQFVELVSSSNYLNALQVCSPHLLRYYAVALVLSDSSKLSAFTQLAAVIAQEEQKHSDAITRFVQALYLDVDFEAAEEHLKECKSLTKGDYFLEAHGEAFFERARALLFRRYCRIHQCVDLTELTKKLAPMSSEDAERWIVDLTRNQLDGHIDSESNHLLMKPAVTSVYTQILEKGKQIELSSRLLQKKAEKR